jgi:hypothetical protein
MSDVLRGVLKDRSDDVLPFAFDVENLVSQAESRRRRTRVVHAVGVVALVAAIVGAVALGPGLRPDPEPAAPPARFAEPKLLYALGDVVHYGGESFETGLEVNRGLARTDYGFVLVHGKEVWFSDGTEREKIGRIADAQVAQSVISDAEGRLVAWVGPDGDGQGEVVVYDSRLGEVAGRLGGMMNLGSVPQLIAIDDGAVYWRRPGGRVDDPLLRYHVSTGEQTELQGPAEAIAADVAGGTVAYYAPSPGPGRLLVDAPGSRSRIGGVFFPADLSPDGSFVVASRKSGTAVFDAGTADEIALHLPQGFAAHQFLGWVDGNTFAFWDGDRRAVLSCEAPTGNCVVALRDPGDAVAVWFPQFPGYHPG